MPGIGNWVAVSTGFLRARTEEQRNGNRSGSAKQVWVACPAGLCDGNRLSADRSRHRLLSPGIAIRSARCDTWLRAFVPWFAPHHGADEANGRRKGPAFARKAQIRSAKCRLVG